MTKISPYLKGMLAIAVLVGLTGVAKVPAIPAGVLADVKIVFLPESKLKLNGDSSLRKFSSVADVLELRGVGKAVSNSLLPFTPTEVFMRLEVKNLKSGDSTLDEHMLEAMKAEKFQTIEMKLERFNLNDPDSATASGVLTIAGVAKPVELKLNISLVGEKINIRGTKNLLMTDFGIQPPTMMMGTIKTKNEIQIEFDVICTTENKQKG